VDLPAALFRDVTGLSEGPGEAFDDRRREARRVFLGQRTTVLRDLAGVSDDASTSMIGRFSTRGMGLVHGSPIPPGEAFTVLLPRVRGEPVAVRCVAVHCHTSGPDAFLIGTAFEAVLSDEYGVEEAGSIPRSSAA
jgi:hypothetical protein